MFYQSDSESYSVSKKDVILFQLQHDCDKLSTPLLCVLRKDPMRRRGLLSVGLLGEVPAKMSENYVYMLRGSHTPNYGRFQILLAWIGLNELEETRK